MLSNTEFSRKARIYLIKVNKRQLFLLITEFGTPHPSSPSTKLYPLNNMAILVINNTYDNKRQTYQSDGCGTRTQPDIAVR